MAHTVLSLAPLPAELVKLLIQQTPGVPDFEVVAGYGLSDEEVRRCLWEADAVLGDYTFKHMITADLVSGASRLKLIQQPSVGYQHIDVDACTAMGIPVANTAGANTESVAEHTIAWGLCLLKNMLHAHACTRECRWEQMSIQPAELKAKVWGIVGFGRIGRAVAARLRPFELSRVLYYDTRRCDRLSEEEFGVEYADLGDLLGTSDIISLHAPLTEDTRNMINRAAINTMKDGVYLINVARAELVDEEALADAVRKGKVAGVGIDVFSREPIRQDNPLLALDSPKVLLSPHVSGVTAEAAGRIINMAVENIARVLRGEAPESLVNAV
jgi:phosphoglycerate dehydrogenase-like enzyme